MLKINPILSPALLFMALMPGLLSACADKAEKTAVAQGHIPLYTGSTQQPWDLYIRHLDSSRLFSGAVTQIPDSDVRLAISDKQVKENALTYRFGGGWSSALYMEGAEPLDLSAFMDSGTLAFDIQVDAIDRGTLALKMDCGQGCESQLHLREWALSVEGTDWQHLSVPLACFSKPGTDFSAVKRPFYLSSGGEGQISIANIQITQEQQGNFACPQRDKLAITPGVLNEYWATEWWMPRHKQKLAEAKNTNAELVMMGDSITHGWEDAGKQVWQQYFGHIPTLNLGFGGDRTENLLWRLQNGEIDGLTPKLTVIMIGTNNTGHRMDSPASIRDGVAAVLDEIRHRTPDTQVLLLAIFPRSETADDPLRQNNRATNLLLEQLARERNILFADFNQAFLTQDGTLTQEIMPDLLHPQDRGYRIWAEQLKPYVERYLK